jgi:hypothetical protein
MLEPLSRMLKRVGKFQNVVPLYSPHEKPASSVALAQPDLTGQPFWFTFIEPTPLTTIPMQQDPNTEEEARRQYRGVLGRTASRGMARKAEKESLQVQLAAAGWQWLVSSQSTAVCAGAGALRFP